MDLPNFAQRASSAHRVDPRRVVRAGQKLINGALRIRRGGDGIYHNRDTVMGLPPVTKPAEAIGAWLQSLAGEAASGERCEAEMQEALLAAAEEVDEATKATPAASRLRSALYTDALGIVSDTDKKSLPIGLPWIIAAVLGGILFGVLIIRKK